MSDYDDLENARPGTFDRRALLGGHQIPSDPQHVLKVVDPLPRVRSLPVTPSEIQIAVQAPFPF